MAQRKTPTKFIVTITLAQFLFSRCRYTFFSSFLHMTANYRVPKNIKHRNNWLLKNFGKTLPRIASNIESKHETYLNDYIER